MPFVVDVQRSLLPQTLSNYPTIICLLNIFEKCEKKTGFSIALTFSSRGDIVYTCFKFQNFAKNC